MDHFLQDIRYALRSFRTAPAVTLIAALTIAIGIGATTAIFSVVNGIVLKPLPYDQPGQLVRVFEAKSPASQNVVTPGVFLDWREQSTLFEGLAAYTGTSMNFTGGGEAERLSGLRMSANGLQLLRARPLVGRVFAADEDQPGKEAEAYFVQMITQCCLQVALDTGRERKETP